MNASGHEDLRGLLAAYALGALEAEELELAEAHLQGCPDCQAELDQYQGVAEKLLYALPPRLPPARLRVRLADRIARGQPLSASRRIPWSRTVLALALAVVALLFLNAALAVELRSLQVRQRTLSQEIQTQNTALALVAYPGSQALSVVSKEGGGAFVLDPDLESGALFAWGLPVLDQAHTYQAWLVKPDGVRVNGGLFTVPRGQTFASVIVKSDQPLSSYSSLGVTVEPRNGSSAPSGAWVLSVGFGS
ncbi:MAG: anti-sigma factor [Anaerolineales bacterium]|jgi:anti-sigma-K factor RskA